MAQMYSGPVHNKHRREVLRKVILPVVGVAILLLLVPLLMIIGLLTHSFSSNQVDTAASFAVLLVLVPMVILMLIPYAILVAMVAGLAYLNRKMRSILDFVLRFSYRLNRVTQRISHAVAKPVIAVNKRMTWAEYVASHTVSGTQKALPAPSSDRR